MGEFRAGPERLVAQRPRMLGAADIAWVLAVPWGLATVAAIALLGRPLGVLAFDPGGDQLWPPTWWEAVGHAEPAKQGGYLIATLSPLLLAGLVLVTARRPITLRPALVRGLTWSAYALILALAALSLIHQRPIIFIGLLAPAPFGPVSLIAAAAVTVAALGVMRHAAVAGRITALARETRGRRRTLFVLALALIAICVLKAVTTDRLSADTPVLNLSWTFDDAIAVLDGRTPLVDFHPIYAKLLPYPTALVLAAFGTTILTYSAFMALLDALVLVAVYAVMRLVTRSSLLALALFAPFVAMSDFTLRSDVTSPMMLSAMWPMRYGGVYLLAWLTARQLAGRRPKRSWVLGLALGLVAINSLEFGIAVVAATVAALLVARPPAAVRDALRLLAELLAGTLGAVALVALLTLAHAGELPDFTLLFEWPRIFATLGWFTLPLPTWGLHVAIYGTCTAAIVLAAVRRARRDEDALLTGMLAWSGVFGVFAGGYFVGRPEVFKLTAMFSAWSFALSMLTVASVRALAERGWRRPTLSQALVLFAFALSATALAHVSLPQAQIDRLTASHPEPAYLPLAESFIEHDTEAGETVVLLVPMSSRIAHDLRLHNVSPYSFMNAIVTRSQMRTLIATLERRHVTKLYMPVPERRLMREGEADYAHVQRLVERGFQPVEADEGITELRRSRPS